MDSTDIRYCKFEMDEMDWNAIKVFVAVSETGSLVRAAERIGLSHATVFRHMSALEEQVGTRLFDRVKGRYVLTDAGAEMRDISGGIVSSFEEIDRRVMRPGRNRSGYGPPDSAAQLFRHGPATLSRRICHRSSEHSGGTAGFQSGGQHVRPQRRRRIACRPVPAGSSLGATGAGHRLGCICKLVLSNDA